MPISNYLNRTYFHQLVLGTALTINFALVWAIPVAGMGSGYKFILMPFLKPLYEKMEANTLLRSFAAKFIYNNPRHADFFALSLIAATSSITSIILMLYYQLKLGYLPYWAFFLYYCQWVGFGGTMMGSAYSLAHKEGHMPNLYQPWIKKYIGNFFENGLGCFFGNVPFNFTTSHIRIHHSSQGGIGDTFYLWDFDRSDFWAFMIYIYRIFLHMIGTSSIKIFEATNRFELKRKLRQGQITYFMVFFAILALTRDLRFTVLFYLQPLFCMNYFLALINIGFHGFLEYNDEGKSVDFVNSSMIINGLDDFFGEDDHMTHHYRTIVYFKDLPEYHKQIREKLIATKASVFHTISIMELSVFVLFGLYDELAKYYVDMTESMTKEEIKAMLKRRVETIEITPERYAKYLENPTNENTSILAKEIQEAKKKKAD